MQERCINRLEEASREFFAAFHRRADVAFGRLA